MMQQEHAYFSVRQNEQKDRYFKHLDIFFFVAKNLIIM